MARCKKFSLRTCRFVLAGGLLGLIWAGEPDPQPAPTSSEASPDPGSEIVAWDGKNWAANDRRAFEARFENFLKSSAAGGDGIVLRITDLLAPGRITPKSTDEAFALLLQAPQSDVDAGLCDAIATRVYAAWLSKRSNDRLAAANQSLEKERRRLAEISGRLTGRPDQQDDPEDQPAMSADQAEKARRIAVRQAEVNALLKANLSKREVAESEAKSGFQALIAEHFLRRRFQHVVIGVQFYRSIFGDGLPSAVGNSPAAKTPAPTVGSLGSLANEAIQDVREGVKVFHFLLEKNELAGAARCLAEAFLPGEYMPEIQALPCDEKQRVLAFVGKSNELAGAIGARDYALAEKLVKDLGRAARDFDSSKPMAAIEIAHAVAAMHIARAKLAAVGGDKPALEAEIKTATEIWPGNPGLAEVGTAVFQQADVQQSALADFDRLMSEKNSRQISDDKMRFMAATVMHPEKQERLRKALGDMAAIDAAILRAQEIGKRGDFAGAWESAESAARQFPGDSKLNQIRDGLATKAPDFIHALEQAAEQEKNGRPAPALACYLKARKIYPASDFARQGIGRINARLLPDAE
ncbi:MAG: hypothetical protein WCQ16_05990 [Verrucomicrobiae bacterium]